MTDPDEDGSGPSDGEDDYATLDEVAAALARLSAPELDRIELRARTLVRGTTLQPRDVVNTVVERLLTRDGKRGRHWHRKETFSDCISRTMKSIVRDYWRRQQIPMIAINEVAAGHQGDLDPEVKLVARSELRELLNSLDDADNTAAIAVAIASGDTPADIRKRFGLSETDYDSALKRIRRRILKYKTSKGQA